MISVALPRQFALSDDDLLRYLTTLFNGVEVPCLVQDFHPGGVTLGADFASRLLAACPNFCYLKLEEPLVARKLLAIREATQGKVKVLDGTGGVYMLELIPGGLDGVMPGLALADAVDLVFELRLKGRSSEAFELYEKLLPRLVFSFQNFELWLYCEKRLLQARGLLSNARCREAALLPDPLSLRYIDEMNDRMLEVLENAGLQARLDRVESKSPSSESPPMGSQCEAAFKYNTASPWNGGTKGRTPSETESVPDE